MGRYRKNPKGLRSKLTLTIDPEVHEEAVALFRAAGSSMSEFVNEMLKRQVKASKGELAKSLGVFGSETDNVMPMETGAESAAKATPPRKEKKRTKAGSTKKRTSTPE